MDGYLFRCVVSNEQYSSDTSAQASLFLDVPQALNATNITTNSFQANWTVPCEASSYDLFVYQAGVLLSGYPQNTTSTSHLVQGLSSCSKYTYEVRVNTVAGPSVFTNTVAVDTKPPVPTNTWFDSVTQSSFRARWDASCATNYNIQIFNQATGTVIATYSTTSTARTITGLACGSYYFRVRALYGNSGWGAWSAASALIHLVPANPVATNATSIAKTTFTANWQASCNATTYELYVYENAALRAGYPINTTGTSYTVAGLNTCTVYTYKVKATNSSGSSDFSSAIEVKTLIGNPANLQNVNITAYAFTAKWDGQSCADTYELQISRDNTWGNSNDCSYFTYHPDSDYAFSSAFWTSSCTESLQPGHTYYWRVRACSASGCSSWVTKSVSMPSGGARIAADMAVEATETSELFPEAELQIWPNPTNDFLEIFYTHDKEPLPLFYSLVDASGRLVMKGSFAGNQRINLSQVPSGLYLLYLQSEDLKINTIEKIIKN